MGKSKFNFVFHRITKTRSGIKNHYDFVLSDAIKLISEMKKFFESRNIELVIFLDDGYKSQFEFAIKVIKEFKLVVYVALISEYIGESGYLSLGEMNILKNYGVKFCSHGVSHAALGGFEDGKVLDTPRGGIYKNYPRGHEKLLFEEEVKFQVIESAKELKRKSMEISSFVYPYGIFNDGIIKIVADSCLYSKAYTCEEKLEDENYSPLEIPRFLAYNDVSNEYWFSKFRKF